MFAGVRAGLTSNMNNSYFKYMAKKVYSHLPDLLKNQVDIGYIQYKLHRLKSLKTPTVLVFFVTTRCNNRCSHCFYWQDLNSSNYELSLEEISKISSTLQHPVHLSLTGGEPFLRKDIVDICRHFNSINHCRNISIATNGYLTQKIVESCAEILRLPLESFSVQVSLDGLEQTHNTIRGVRDSFRNALETIKLLSQLSNSTESFNISASITIQQKNLHEIEDLINLLIPISVPIRFALVRGQHFGTYGLNNEIANTIDPMEADAPVNDICALSELFNRIRDINDSSQYRFWSEQQQEKIRLSLQMMSEKKKHVTCYAGIIDGVLYANGEVALCELTRPIGNVRDFDLNFTKLWNSANAHKLRDGIRHCFCIHGCNLATSMTFSPSNVRSMLEKS